MCCSGVAQLQLLEAPAGAHYFSASIRLAELALAEAEKLQAWKAAAAAQLAALMQLCASSMQPQSEKGPLPLNGLLLEAPP